MSVHSKLIQPALTGSYFTLDPSRKGAFITSFDSQLGFLTSLYFQEFCLRSNLHISQTEV